MNNLNPAFATAIEMDYYFEAVQNLRICVVDVDSSSASLRAQDIIGEARVTLAELVGAASGKWTKELHTSKSRASRGQLTVLSEEVGNTNASIFLTLAGSGLDKKDFFGKSDPYVLISKAREDGTFVLVHKTEIVKNTLDPRFAEIKLSLATLCAGDMDRSVRFEVFDWDQNSDHDLIGATECTVRELVDGAQFPLINAKKQKKKGKKYQNSGVLLVRAARIVKSHTLIEYIQAGFQINMMVAVDFTASNGCERASNRAALQVYPSPLTRSPRQRSDVCVVAACVLANGAKLVPASFAKRWSSIARV